MSLRTSEDAGEDGATNTRWKDVSAGYSAAEVVKRAGAFTSNIPGPTRRREAVGLIHTGHSSTRRRLTGNQECSQRGRLRRSSVGWQVAADQ